MEVISSIGRRKREIVDEIQYLSHLKEKVNLFLCLPTLGIILILSHYYFKSKLASLEQDFLSLTEVERRLLVINGNLVVSKIGITSGDKQQNQGNIVKSSFG